MKITAAQLGELLNADLEGDPNVVITGPGKIEDAQQGEITFLANPKYEPYAYCTKASVILVGKDFQPKQAIRATLLRVDDVYQCITQLLSRFERKVEVEPGISASAHVDKAARVASSASVGHFAVVEAGAEIGADTIISSQVFIGRNVKIGQGCILYPGVRIQEDCIVGNHCILNSNAVIGSDGFGFSPDASGKYQKIVQMGNVILEDDVEVGANTTIDRATMGSTILRRGVKLDNLIMVAHNVEIGEDTVVAAQAGFAGSTKIGRGCMIGGQVGFVGHIHIADGTKVQAQSGVNKSIKEENQAWYGSPVLSYKDYLRSYAVFRKLPELARRIKELEKRIAADKRKG